ncbi:uncharacterized protein LOC129598296 isoform X2 [Paramacrobiotus metropolitanus]|uniref:uncharacterized protein LOC129598296 isoform X2 n=1 Tax=Paramacrobiotus metropolitanus TaxID=2943436 RepID=UPI002446446C|nr:uncharacterized protein LOC129598296 isoform X2 [Paramacrobiotus metropolitanus]
MDAVSCQQKPDQSAADSGKARPGSNVQQSGGVQVVLSEGNALSASGLSGTAKDTVVTKHLDLTEMNKVLEQINNAPDYSAVVTGDDDDSDAELAAVDQRDGNADAHYSQKVGKESDESSTAAVVDQLHKELDAEKVRYHALALKHDEVIGKYNDLVEKYDDSVDHQKKLTDDLKLLTIMRTRDAKLMQDAFEHVNSESEKLQLERQKFQLEKEKAQKSFQEGTAALNKKYASFLAEQTAFKVAVDKWKIDKNNGRHAVNDDVIFVPHVEAGRRSVVVQDMAEPVRKLYSAVHKPVFVVKDTQKLENFLDLRERAHNMQECLGESRSPSPTISEVSTIALAKMEATVAELDRRLKEQEAKGGSTVSAPFDMDKFTDAMKGAFRTDTMYPEKFDGKTDTNKVEQFIQSVDNCKNHNSWSDGDVISKCLSRCLTGTALTWYLDKYDSNKKLKWSEWKKLLREHFSDEKDLMAVRDKIADRHFTSYDTPNSYVDWFTTSFKKLDLNESERVYYLKQGLKKNRFFWFKYMEEKRVADVEEFLSELKLQYKLRNSNPGPGYSDSKQFSGRKPADADSSSVKAAGDETKKTDGSVGDNGKQITINYAKRYFPDGQPICFKCHGAHVGKKCTSSEPRKPITAEPPDQVIKAYMMKKSMGKNPES